MQKLTKWKKEPSLNELQDDFLQAQQYQSTQVADIQKWRSQFFIKTKPKKDSTNSTISPALIRKQGEWRCPALSEVFLSTESLFKVDPVTHEDKRRAIQNELILNNQFNTKIAKTRFIDSLIRSLVIDGTAVIRTGWEYQEETKIENIPQYSYQPAPPEFGEQLQQLIQLQQTQPDYFLASVSEDMIESVKVSMQYGQPVQAVITGYEEIEKVIPVVNKPTLEICTIENVYPDPTCEGDITKAQFIIHSFESSLSDLKKDGRYKNLDQINVEGNEGQSSPFHTYSDSNNFSFKDKARKKLTVYEYWGFYDIEGTGIVKPILATWVGNVMIRLEENPFPDKALPFIFIPYIPKDRSLYGVPDGELLEDNQKILGAITRGAIDLLGKSANSQTGIAKGVLDATNRARFRKGLDYEYNPNTNPQAQIYMHKYPEIPQSAMILIQMMNNEAEAISGVKAFSGQGITGAGLGQTAQGVRSAMDAASKREMSILRRIADGVIQVGRKIISMNSAFLSEEETVRITNEQFIKIRADDLAGNFDLRLSISTPEADEAKAQELAMMLQTIGNNMDAGMRNMILANIARLRKMPDLAFSLENYQPEPDPIQEQMQQLQLQLLQAQVALTQAQAQEATGKGLVHQAKVGVEEARAESLQGDADIKTQKFMDDLSGKSYTHELEKLQMQLNNLIEQQRLKNQGNLLNTKASHDLNEEAKSTGHNLDLLKLKAQADLSTGQVNNI